MEEESRSSPLEALCAPGTRPVPEEEYSLPPWFQVASLLEELASSSPDAAPVRQGSVIHAASRGVNCYPMFDPASDLSEAGSNEAAPSAPPAPRRARSTDLDKQRLMHDKILGQFLKWGLTAVNVPENLFLDPEHTRTNLDERQKLPSKSSPKSRDSENALVAEQIRLLPGSICRALLSKLGRACITALADASGSTADCVARLYLGRKGGSSESKAIPFEKYRSINFHQMLKIQMDVEVMARKVAVAMAVLHWGAKVDGWGVKFLLGGSCETLSWHENSRPISHGSGSSGSSSTPNASGPSKAAQEVTQRTTKLWLIDFHRLRPMTMDNDGLAEACKAIRYSDPYFPRPLQDLESQKKAWNAFVMGYIAASEIILRDNGEEEFLELPFLLICRLIDMEKIRASSKDEDHVE
ncbi:hypothetical protein V8C44DRAFT_308646 [Trichoderma aethiopicum]